MKKASVALPKLIIMLFFFLAATVSNAQTYEVYSPGDGYLNLRTGPSTNYTIIQKMYNGSTVQVVGSSGNWRKVHHESGALGWAHRDYLVKLAAPAPGAQWLVVYSPNDGFLNLRTGPSTAYAIIQPMHNGQNVLVLKKSGNWLQVQHQSGVVGWAYAKYLLVP